MVFFFIADLALTLACKFSVWCLRKTYNGIAHLVTYRHPQPQSHALDDDDCVVVTITRQEYDALRKRDAQVNHLDDDNAVNEVSSSVSVSSPSSPSSLTSLTSSK